MGGPPAGIMAWWERESAASVAYLRDVGGLLRDARVLLSVAKSLERDGRDGGI